MNDRLQALRLFQRVARLGSFSRAGRERGLSQPSVSRIIADLEAALGATLFLRTTRAVSLTEAGLAYLTQIEPLLAALDEADHSVRGTGELRGTLQVALSSGFGVREVVPRLPAFMARHPLLRVNLNISDQRQNLVADGIDIAFRLGDLPDSSVIARKLASAPRVLVASPNYLAGAPQLDHPSDLTRHHIIAGPGIDPQQHWAFQSDQRRLSVRIDGRVSTGANEAAIAAAVAGLGIARASLWGCRAELEAGALVRLLPAWQMSPVALHAIFPGGGRASPAARALADFVSDALQAPDTLT
ncbi:MAG: LysR family transcriptional regulator [Sphingomonas sp.]|uniref:LysR family transcriptional regulator n=1 Tax=Sphingomonas sp. TaxID=28214 RepID=UPI00180BB1AB|nr:LysR family transcriptional regulator [Zymomonas sp.]MBA4772237.1 LysR family transcriptional regulator [Sphingomonas sp.]